MSQTMTMKERLIHTALFELGAVIVGSLLAVKFSTANPKLAVGVVVGLGVHCNGVESFV